ncbi:MAG: hypothetical protein U9N58_04540, partial [Thermodesulfobacteriota bacterium]|nr:hypothetical protein [Thermodesulfobacteriota bacterium]
ETDKRWEAHIRKTEALITDQITKIENLRKEIENDHKLIKEVTMERDRWLSQTEMLRSSFSWRITGPLRSARRFQLQLKKNLKQVINGTDSR